MLNQTVEFLLHLEEKQRLALDVVFALVVFVWKSSLGTNEKQFSILSLAGILAPQLALEDEHSPFMAVFTALFNNAYNISRTLLSTVATYPNRASHCVQYERCIGGLQALTRQLLSAAISDQSRNSNNKEIQGLTQSFESFKSELAQKMGSLTKEVGSLTVSHEKVTKAITGLKHDLTFPQGNSSIYEEASNDEHDRPQSERNRDSARILSPIGADDKTFQAKENPMFKVPTNPCRGKRESRSKKEDATAITANPLTAQPKPNANTPVEDATLEDSMFKVVDQTRGGTRTSYTLGPNERLILIKAAEAIVGRNAL